MFVLIWIRKVYKALSADASPSAIAFAMAFGITLGLVPILSGLGLFLIACILVFRVQMASALLALGLTKILYAAGLARVTASVGESLLEAGALRGFWTWLCNLPVIAWFDLNWVAVTGGAAVGIVLGAAIFWPVRVLVIGYRRAVHERVSQNRFFRWLTNFWFIKLLRFIFIGARAAS